MFKKSIILLLIVSLVMFFASLPVTASTPIKVTINEVPLSFDVPPIIIEGRTLVPLRAIFETLGATVNWEAETRTITAVKDQKTIVLTIDDKVAFKNQQQIDLDVPAMIIEARTLVPIRFISESLGAAVSWCGETRTVSIVAAAALSEPYAASFDPEAITVHPTTEAKIVSNQIIVRFREGLARATIEAVITEFGCTVAGEIPVLNIYQLKIPDGAHPVDLVDQFKKSPHVKWAQVNYIIYTDTLMESVPVLEADDRYFSDQWALHNTGQGGGNKDADIDAPEAWVMEKGHPNVTIAILDTGVNYKHEDLKDNLRMSAGIVWDFIDNDFEPLDEGDPNRHGYGHGTAMAGITVAGMNDKGIVGVAPQATFLPVRVLDQGDQVDAVGESFALTTGILFAVNKGNARIINISLGVHREMFALRDAIEVIGSRDDVLLIASAGNEIPLGIPDMPPRLVPFLGYPAAFPEVMAVAATLHDDRRASYSNYGDWIDVSAPGGSRGTQRIRSTALHKNDSYGWSGGTSAAAPFVSGVAALVWSLDYRADGDFDLSASEVREIIKASADNIDHLNPGYEGKLGTGRVNAHKALLEAERRLGLHQQPLEKTPEPAPEPTPKEWKRTFGGSSDDVARSVQQTSDGGFIIAGYTHSFGAGEYDFWLVKTDADGNKEWERTFGGARNDRAYSVQQTMDGGFIIAGYTLSFGVGGYDFWLVKTDAAGNKEWDNTFGGTGHDRAYSVQQRYNGGFILVGEIESFHHQDFLVIITDALGTRKGYFMFGSRWEVINTLPGTDVAYSVQRANGGFIIAGGAKSPLRGDSSFKLVKIDAVGNKEWESTFGGPDWSGWEEAYSVQQADDGGFIITGYTEAFGAGRKDFWLVKIDEGGKKKWHHTFGGSRDDIAQSVQQTSDGGFIIAGYTGSFGAGRDDFWLVKTDATGNKKWDRTFGGSNSDRAYSVQQTSDGGFVLAGVTESFGAGGKDFWLIKVPPVHE